MTQPPGEGTPTDDAPNVTRHGSSDVRAAVVSMSARSPEGLDAAYLEWHGLDHLPEQYRITGMRSGARWVSTPACRAARAAGVGHYDAVDHVVCYLFAEPLDSALDTFFALGADLRAVGRMPVRLPPVELAGYELVAKSASPRALVGADVLPWRPCRGVYLLLEQSPTDDLATTRPQKRGPFVARSGGEVVGALADVPGVAGVWSYEGTGSLHPRLTGTDGLRLSIAFLDDHPPTMASRLDDVLADRWADGSVVPLLATPLVTVVPWAWDAHLPT